MASGATAPHVGRAIVLVVVLVAALPALAGCLQDDVTPEGPLSTMQAYRLAFDESGAEDSQAHLVAFVGHEGPSPAFLPSRLGEHAVDEDTSYDMQRADGRSHVWAFLFATPDGKLYRSTVRAGTLDVETAWVVTVGESTYRSLWAANLGGRLVHDSTQVLQTIRDGDAEIAAYLAKHPEAHVAYASTVAVVDDPSRPDMVYDVFFGYPEDATVEEPGYAHFAQVHHFTGQLVRTGTPEDRHQERLVTLAEGTFTLTPLVREVHVPHELDRRVSDATMTVETSGSGRYTVEVLKDNSTRVGDAVESQVLPTETGRHEVQLGELEPGTYVLHVSALGTVTFDIKVTGAIVVG